MQNLILGTLLAFNITLNTPPQAQIAPPVRVNEVQLAISRYAFVYDIPEEKLAYIIHKESTGSTTVIGDMDIVCKRTGKPVRARGILQITECYYPEISDECAFDIDCSIRTMAEKLKDHKTCREQWTTCRQYVDKKLAKG